MRRKEWKRALIELRTAEKLAPTVAGIRLNIGLVYYRQREFAAATPLFESVVRDIPGSAQASYLLGLCYLFHERSADAVRVLAPLWEQEAGKFAYLYVVAVAAGNAGQADLERRALTRMLEIGNDSTEYHMMIGKASLQRADNDRAISELERRTRGVSDRLKEFQATPQRLSYWFLKTDTSLLRCFIRRRAINFFFAQVMFRKKSGM